MKRRALVLLAVLVLSIHARADAEPSPAATFPRVWTAHRDADSFRRISEYFTGVENTGGARLLRTQPAERAGFYFTARLEHAVRSPLPAGTLLLHVIPPDGQPARTFRFPLTPDTRRSLHLEIGLTGSDWTFGAGPLPLAWKLEYLDASGAPIASRASFLWEKPAAPTNHN